jgi:hypothetical protein
MDFKFLMLLLLLLLLLPMRRLLTQSLLQVPAKHSDGSMPCAITSSGGAPGTAAGSCASPRMETNAFLPRPTRLNAGRLTPAALALAASAA